MKIKFEYILITLFVIPFFSGCSGAGNIGQFDDAVVDSKTDQYKFKQITFTISVVNNKNEYLNTTQIDSVKIKVNGKDWGTFRSESFDTTSYTTNVINNLKFSDLKVSYLVIAPYILKTDNLETAGDFVDYLNNRIVLTPGDYICEISEIKFHDLNDKWISFKPQIYSNFKVLENNTSSYVGDITLTLRQQ